MTILVTGATGTVGRRVVEQLLAAGQEVRALTTRDPSVVDMPKEAHVVQGDLTRPGTLTAALEGVEGVHLFSEVAKAAEEFVHLAQNAGVRRVVVFSSQAVAHPRDFAMFSVAYHTAVERAVERADFEWTILRPTGFAANTLEWASSIREEGVVRTPYPNAAQALIHEADIAAVAVKALTENGHAEQKYLLTGPEPINKIDQVKAIGGAIGRDIRFETLSPVQWRTFMVPYAGELVADMMLGHWAEADTEPEAVDPTLERVLGRPARTFAQWALDHRSDFS
ncbi:NAD(P)H-binding protein [Nonomuraea sp. NPDC050394]|uniref:NAD(P)H-binding protein n=1 Tax=Nonomuraea sp. NPDC050394 TaxID=3364363 RepID=UPI0037A03044